MFAGKKYRRFRGLHYFGQTQLFEFVFIWIRYGQDFVESVIWDKRYFRNYFHNPTRLRNLYMFITGQKRGKYVDKSYWYCLMSRNTDVFVGSIISDKRNFQNLFSYSDLFKRFVMVQKRDKYANKSHKYCLYSWNTW